MKTYFTNRTPIVAIFFLANLTLLMSPLATLADDTAIYGITTIDVNPNVLVLFDSSGSMATEDVSQGEYDPTTIYDITDSNCYATGGEELEECQPDALYVQSGQNNNRSYHDVRYGTSDFTCSSAKEDLTNKGYWFGTLTFDSDSGKTICGTGNDGSYQVGNYINFPKKLRLVVAKDVVAKLIADNHKKVNFGIIKLNPNGYGGKIASVCASDNKTTLIGKYNPDSPPTFKDKDQSDDYGVIGGMVADGGTPLGETLAEAGLYFAGKNSWFGHGKYTSPIQYRCQQNYIIVITDGEPTYDVDIRMAYWPYINNKAILSYGHDGEANINYAMYSYAEYIDDVAYVLKNIDIRPIGNSTSSEDKMAKGEVGDFYEDQTVTTYTIGFKTEQELLQNTATNGGGQYYTANNASSLNEALNSIIVAIKNNNDNFSGAAVPASQANNVYSGNYVYYGLFQPTSDGNWNGNIKKYKLEAGKILDKNGQEAIVNGNISSAATSFWSTEVDGFSVTKGGAAGKLEADMASGDFSRNIYTYIGNNKTLTDSTNSFAKTNTKLKNDPYSLTDLEISFARREIEGQFPLGDFLHSLPKVIHYDTNNSGNNDKSVIFAGSNDGMLHAFDDTKDGNGRELWAFIPPGLLNKIPAMATSSDKDKKYFIDGTAVIYNYTENTTDKKLLFIGERRGGSTYTALDISSYNTPVYKYDIKNNLLGTDKETLGQSWGTAQRVTLGKTTGATYSTDQYFLLPGGYDTNQDLDTPESTDSLGRAVIAVKATTGDLFNNATFSHDSISEMTHSIVAVSGFENPNTNTTTRIYAGDMDGNVFAYRDDIYSLTTDNTQSTYDGKEDGTWEQKIKLHSVPGRKIFYSANVTNEYYDVNLKNSDGKVETVARVGDFVFFGTGDRANPIRKDIENRFYAIKNSWDWSHSNNIPNMVEAYIDTADGGKIKELTSKTEITSTTDFILDLTDNIYQSNHSDLTIDKLYKSYVKAAINAKNNKGWFIRFVDDSDKKVGEKLVSVPVIYAGVVYFTTYIPKETTGSAANDPCANASSQGNGYLYALDYKYATAVNNYSTTNDDASGQSRLGKPDRRRMLKTQGLPPQPVIVIQEDGVSVVTGFELEDPAKSPHLIRKYWRQISK